MKQKKLFSIVTPGLLGNVLEWYDFALYGYFSGTLAPLFFPTDQVMISRIAAFAVFAIGFFMRPLGAIVFGYFGDRHGRKNALASAILLMAIPTTLIGTLPTYQAIGVASPILLIICRLLQGLAVGGEFTGSLIYIIEHSPSQRRGFYGGLTMSSALVGLLIGSFAALIVNHYFYDVSYAWRIPFLLSFILGFIGLYLRLGMPESPVFLAASENHNLDISPLMHVLKTAKAKVFHAILLVMLPSCGFYLSFVYFPSYLSHHFDIKLNDGLLANTLTMLIIIFFLPLFGLLSDFFGRKPILFIGSGLFFLLSPLLYYLLPTAGIYSVYLVLICFAFMISCSYAIIPSVLVELFETQSRYTGLSLPYNLANALFGGTAPLAAAFLIHLTGNIKVPGYYLSFLALITMISICFLKETYRDKLL